MRRYIYIYIYIRIHISLILCRADVRAPRAIRPCANVDFADLPSVDHYHYIIAEACRVGSAPAYAIDFKRTQLKNHTT